MELYDYQQGMVEDIAAAYRDGARVVMPVLPTGGGKTVVFAHVLQHCGVPSLAIAHRAELVGQISGALARSGVSHNIIAARATLGQIVRQHVTDHGRSWYKPGASVHVASVDTLLRGQAPAGIGQWVVDEGHHLLADNKWGRAVAMLPESARGLAVTATPCRADGAGLGRHADGLVDVMLEGPTMRDLIQRGRLTDYRLIAPPSDLDLADVAIGSTGDYSGPQLKAAVRRSHLVGDVVAAYRAHATGKLGVTFVPDVETAADLAAQYRAAGVAAEAVSANTPATLRADILRRFRARELLQLVNVDLFGEGFDLPAIEVVSMARPTASLALYMQQFGRGLRTMGGKQWALILDHVGNWVRHGLPDKPRIWSLDRRERKSKAADDVPQLRVCESCTGVFERHLRECPYCGTRVTQSVRTGPEAVDGDLSEIDPEVLARMRGEVARIDGAPRYPHDASPVVRASIDKRHAERQRVQGVLRDQIASWAGYQRALGRSDDESYRRFYLRFGIDVLSAQALGSGDAGKLAERVRDAVAEMARDLLA